MKRLGIIVPYRRRHEHLKLFLQRAVDYCTVQGYTFRIIIVEQDSGSAFNRGMLCNIGYKEAKRRRCDYVVFHDVDMLPVDVDYSFEEHPVHLASDEIPFESYFGGMTLFPAKDFEKINGFSNLYWGWGFEDDDLRYRCVKHGIKFDIQPETPKDSKTVLAIFNGVDAYAELNNVINFNRDFDIKIKTQLDRLTFDHEQPSDTFPIFSIKGNDFILSYSSFNRFHLQFFDNYGTYHDIFTDIVSTSITELRVSYSNEDKKVTLFLNGKEEGSVELPTSIFKYLKGNPILLGTNPDKSKFFKGTIDQVTISNGYRPIVEYLNTSEGREYRFVDLSGRDNHANLINVYFDKFKPPVNYNGYVPFRRHSKIYYLKHQKEGFDGGRWKDDLTRWNQLRYNNEVLVGGHDNLEDGLSTCKFTLHSKRSTKNIIHLKVGI
jgi:hypothetical protein